MLRMLISYFLRHFFIKLFFCSVLLTSVLIACNLCTKLALIQSLFLALQFMLAFVPVAALFVLPLATTLAVHGTIVLHRKNNQLLLLASLKPAWLALIKATALFSLVVGMVYGYCAFYYAPRSYLAAKKLLVHAAQQYLYALQPGIVHKPCSGCVFFCTDKKREGECVQFNKLFFVFTQRGQQHLITAARGTYDGQLIQLYDGSVAIIAKAPSPVMRFDRARLPFALLADAGNQADQPCDYKYATLPLLWHKRGTCTEAFMELHKRIAATLWLLLMPLIALLFAWRSGTLSLLTSMMHCGALYAVCYIVLALAYIVTGSRWLTLGIFYTPIMLLGMVTWCWYHRVE